MADTSNIFPNWTPEQPLLQCEGLSISYFTRAGEIPAVLDFDLTVMQGEAVGLVGESGCGTSTVAMGIMRYLRRNRASPGGASSTRAATWRISRKRSCAGCVAARSP